MPEPFAEKQVELGFLVGLVHGRVRVGVNAAKAPGVLGADHFGHARVVIDLHFQLRHRQPGQAVFLAHPHRRGIGAGFQHFQRQHAEQHGLVVIEDNQDAPIAGLETAIGQVLDALSP